MHHERDHFSKVKGLKACKDKIFMSMLEDVTREKALRGELNREDVDEKNTRKFLFLSKRRTITQVDKMKEVREEEFRVVVKQEKILITSSMFSKRDHSAFKCAMHCEIIMRVLVRHCT